MEDVAAGDTVGALKVERRDRVASEDVVTKVRREAEQGFEHPILELLLAAVPVALGKREGQVPDAEAHLVLALGCEAAGGRRLADPPVGEGLGEGAAERGGGA